LSKEEAGGKMKFAYLLFSYLLLIFLCMACTPRVESTKRNCVNDYVNLLSTAQQKSLTAEIIALDESIGSQIAIVIIDTLNGEKIDDYSFKKAKEWALGREQYNDGILITLSIKDRKTRIEVGEGLEKIITDETAAKIIREEMVPDFKRDKYYEGMLAAIVKIKSLIKEHKDLIGQNPR
jgi:uncharacterized protein